MTKKLFWEDPYQTTLETTVASVVGSTISLRETIFYAFSGGQESDAGTIGGYPVIEAIKSDLDIRYVLPEEHQLVVGDQVRVVIDWERRHRLMRLHFAAELVLELVYRALPDVGKIGAHISEDKARLDFSWPESLTPLLPELTPGPNSSSIRTRRLSARSLTNAASCVIGRLPVLRKSPAAVLI